MILNTTEYYIDLRLAYSFVTENTTIHATINEIADILCCTLRNARHLLKKMQSEGFIEWTPGQGRGNRSHLTFKISLSSVIILSFKDYLQQNKVEQALQLINRREIPADIRKKCYRQLQVEFDQQNTQTEDVPKNKPTPLPKGITLNHMVRQVNNQTSSWMIEKKPLKQSVIRWPSTDK